MRLYGAFLLPAPFHQPPRKFKHRFSEVYAGGKSVNLTPRRSILLIDEMDIHRGGPNQAPFNHIFSEYKRGGVQNQGQQFDHCVEHDRRKFGVVNN